MGRGPALCGELPLEAVVPDLDRSLSCGLDVGVEFPGFLT